MIFIFEFLFLICTYFICAIPFGLILTQFFLKQDIRQSGSGNIGATNVTRIAGKKLGALTLLLDGFKGALMVIAGRWLFDSAAHLHLFLVVVSIVAVLGHIYPVYLKFKGGKGVATALAVLLALDPIVGFLSVIMWILFFVLFRISAVASLTAMFSSILSAWYYGAPISEILLCIFLFVLIAIRHKENIIRIITGQEKKM